MGKMTIRHAISGDYSLCLPLLASFYHGDIGKNFRNTFENYVAGDSGVVLLTQSQDRVVGILIGSFRMDIDWEGKTAIIDAVIVDETTRRMGIGKKLVLDFINLAQERNCKAVKSRINMNNEDAQKFHENMGFERAHTYEYLFDLQKP